MKRKHHYVPIIIPQCALQHLMARVLRRQFRNAEEAELPLFLLAQQRGQDSRHHVVIGIGQNGVQKKDIDVIGTQ